VPPTENARAIIDLIFNEPNKRITPAINDLSGDFDYWFDGGAVIVQTGLMEYFFNDGRKALKSILKPGENYIRITWADGSSETIHEKDWR
jgi:hypothetical protein